MPVAKENPLALLFARHASSQPCRCAGPGYCPAHGTYNPPTDDLEVLQAVEENTTARRTATRVIRRESLPE